MVYQHERRHVYFAINEQKLVLRSMWTYYSEYNQNHNGNGRYKIDDVSGY